MQPTGDVARGRRGRAVRAATIIGPGRMRSLWRCGQQENPGITGKRGGGGCLTRVRLQGQRGQRRGLAKVMCSRGRCQQQE